MNKAAEMAGAKKPAKPTAQEALVEAREPTLKDVLSEIHELRAALSHRHVGAATVADGDPLMEAERIASAFFKPRDVSSAIISQARLRRKRMEELEERHGLLASDEIAELFGSQARNRGSVASRWLSNGEIFAVQAAGKQRFPGFQFDKDGEPLPVIREILEALPFNGGWEVAIWFDTPHPSLPKHATPAEILVKDQAMAHKAAVATRDQANAWV